MPTAAKKRIPPKTSANAAARAAAPAPVRPPGGPKRDRTAGRAEKSAARRLAIVAAALDEFSARGFAATRIDDVARRAGVAKGTIYLHFRDKEALFQEIVRTMLGPIVSALEAIRPQDRPIRPLITSFIDLFVREVYGTKRRDVLRLVMTEGPRFPKLAEFHYREVVERGVAAMRGLLEQALARGELEHEALVRFPQLLVAPAIVAIIWSGLFDRFAPLDVAGLMHAQLDIVFGKETAS
jgi:AcrR family transcriptional regulator